MKNKTRHQQQGFSLVELTIALAILGLIMAIVVPNVMGKFKKAKVDSTRIQIQQLVSTLKNYYLDCGQYPTTDQKLEALVKAPSSEPKCKSFPPDGYMKKVPKDGWDMDFIYESDGFNFEIISLGEDRKTSGTDYAADISSKELE